MLIDNFDYDNSGALIDVAGGLWATHSGTVRVNCRSLPASRHRQKSKTRKT